MSWTVKWLVTFAIHIDLNNSMEWINKSVIHCTLENISRFITSEKFQLKLAMPYKGWAVNQDQDCIVRAAMNMAFYKCRIGRWGRFGVLPIFKIVWLLLHYPSSQWYLENVIFMSRGSSEIQSKAAVYLLWPLREPSVLVLTSFHKFYTRLGERSHGRLM